MRIVYLNPVGKLGGAEALLLDLLASMKQMRPDWDLDLILPAHGIVADRASAIGVTVHVVAMPPAMTGLGDSGPRSRKWALPWRILRALPESLVYYRRLRHKIHQLKPDVLHSNGFKMHLLSICSGPTGTPVLWHIHDFVSRRPVMARLLPRVARRCSAAVANSEHVRKDLRALCPNLPVTTVFNAVDLDEFLPAGTVCDLDRLSGLPESGDIVRVGLVATMARWKGHKVFLEALSRISSSVPVRAYLIGGAIYGSDDSQCQVEELRSLATRLGLAGRVGFTGFVMRPAEAIRALDIVVHASTEPEPFGLAIAEAMACGKAVIASSQGGPEEFLHHEVNGLTHRSGDAEDLARKIERLLGDSALRVRLGGAARDSAIRLFDRRRLAAEMIPVYESVRNHERVDAQSWVVDAGGGEIGVRVLHIYSGNLNGGVESLLKTLAANRRLCPTMEAHFALSFEGALATGLRSAKVPVTVLGTVRVSRPLTVLRARKKMAEFLRRERFDVAICHSSWPHAIFAPVVRAAHMPLVHWRHDAPDGKHWTDRWAARTAPDLVICNSYFTAGTLQQVYPGVPRSILYCPASASGAWTAEELLETRKKLETPPGWVAIVQPSRLEPWKGHRQHLQALSLLAKLPEWVCWIAGAPQRPSEELYWKSLQEDVRRYGIADRVRFPGWVEDIPKLLAAAQIHCQPNSGPEPFGLTFIEGMSAGLPVVTTSCGASREIVTADSGILVAPGDPDLLANALERLIRDPDLRASLGAGGRVRARELCDPERQMNRLAGALAAVAAEARAPHAGTETCIWGAAFMTRVALIADFLEDRWYSMDLVAEMLMAHLPAQYAETHSATLIRPAMKLRFGAVPLLAGRSGARKADQVLNRFLEYPRVLRDRRAQFDIFHIVDHSYGHLVHDLPAGRTLLTCHDLDAFRCLTEPASEPRSGLFRAMTRRILSGFQKAAKVACSSMATRDEILRFGLIPAERLAVTPLAVDPVFSTTPDAAADLEADRWLGPARTGAIDIVHVGSTVARKRIDILLRVFSKVKQHVPHARLVRIGSHFTAGQTAMMDRLKLRDSTVEIPFVERRHLPSVYRRSSVVLVPSEREGFGLPVVEAMACGAPVIASDIAVLRETAGTAAAFCPLEDVDAWCDCVLNTISRAAGSREQEAVRAAGIAQASKFTWPAYAAGNARLYRELLNR